MSQEEKKEEEEEEGNELRFSPSPSIFNKPGSKLQEEIRSWTPLVESLNSEDQELLRDLLERASAYLNSIETCQDEQATEAFLLSLLVSNQRTLNSLSNKISILASERQRREQEQQLAAEETSDQDCANPDCLHKASRHSRQGICLILACPCKKFDDEKSQSLMKS